MEQENRGIRDKRILCAAIAVLITVTDYAVCRRHGSMLYLTNDETIVQNWLSGFNLGENYPIHQLISIFEGYPLAFLYKMIPDVQWWYVYSLTLMLIGIFLVNYSFLYVGLEKRDGYWDTISDRLVLTASLVFFNVAYAVLALEKISFGIVSAIYASGLLALLFLRGLAGQIRVINIVIIFVLFLPALFHRKDSAYAVLCYLLMVLLWALVKRNSIWKGIGIWVKYSLIILICIGAFVRIDAVYQERINGKEFVDFNKARVWFVDDAVDSYDENPELYKAVGWTRDTYTMAKEMCFVDDKISADALSYIAKNSTIRKIEYDNESGNLFDDQADRSLLIGFVLFSIFAVIVLVLLRDYYGLVFALFDIAGTVILIAYQFLIGRVIFRGLIACILPAFVVMALLVMSSKGTWSAPGNLTRIVAGTISFAIVTASLVQALFFGECFADLRFDRSVQDPDADNPVYSYIINHKDNIYVYPANDEPIVPRSPYKNDISNSFSWGGVDYNSYARRLLLKKNGLDRLDDETFLKDNVYLISNETTGVRRRCLNSFFNWMGSVHPEYDVIRVDMIDANRNVYQFVKKEERR